MKRLDVRKARFMGNPVRKDSDFVANSKTARSELKDQRGSGQGRLYSVDGPQRKMTELGQVPLARSPHGRMACLATRRRPRNVSLPRTSQARGRRAQCREAVAHPLPESASGVRRRARSPRDGSAPCGRTPTASETRTSHLPWWCAARGSGVAVQAEPKQESKLRELWGAHRSKEIGEPCNEDVAESGLHKILSSCRVADPSEQIMVFRFLQPMVLAVDFAG